MYLTGGQSPELIGVVCEVNVRIWGQITDYILKWPEPPPPTLKIKVEKTLWNCDASLTDNLFRRYKIILSFPVTRPTHGKNPRPKKFTGSFQQKWYYG